MHEEDTRPSRPPTYGSGADGHLEEDHGVGRVPELGGDLVPGRDRRHGGSVDFNVSVTLQNKKVAK